MSYLLDTNILGRLIQKNHPMHPETVAAVRKLRKNEETLCIIPQNLIEFWVVATRPATSNGLGLTVDEAVKEVRKFKRLFSLQLDAPSIYARWERLVKHHKVMGKTGHDTHLVAAMLTHNLTHLLTFNTADFKRYSDCITVIAPKDV